MMTGATHFVYIARCADGTLYTGYSLDPAHRVKAHNKGRGARYTSGRRPVELIYIEEFASATDALRREWQLKRWPRRDKEALVAANPLSAIASDRCGATEARRGFDRGATSRRISRSANTTPR